MADAALLACEVAYARPDRQFILSLSVPEGTTVEQAFLLSGLAVTCPEIDIQTAVLGIFGRVVPREQLLRAGDRIEVYRPLSADPRSARRARVKAARNRR